MRTAQQQEQRLPSGIRKVGTLVIRPAGEDEETGLPLLDTDETAAERGRKEQSPGVTRTAGGETAG